ncbi:MAG: monovalent cation/H+ antiporter subunit D family protein [Planctomycetota bacterium]|nr:MAG: monovalent cation/H+ antiporter subunit D family protein [Planctomycetota bacterium]
MSLLERNLPALVVVLPLVGGLLAALVGRNGRAWWLALATSWLVFALVGWQVHELLEVPGGVRSYTLGGWLPRTVEGVAGPVPVGIEYRIDLANGLVLLVVSGIAAWTTLSARAIVRREVPEDRLHFFYAVWLLCLTGLLGITITGDAFNVYVLLEITSLTSYALIAMGKRSDRRALTASFHYLCMGTVGASFFLLGLGYLLMATGTLNMVDMAHVLAERGADRSVVVAYALVVVGLCLKMGLFPLHQWLPNAYTYAPSAVTSFLASTATKVGVYVGLRFTFTIFLPGRVEHAAADALLAMSCVAIVYGSLRAVQQTNVKRLLAYSSVAQIGYMALGLALASPLALAGALLHLLNHALVKGALFVATSGVVYRTGSSRLASFRGLFHAMPASATILVLAGLGLVGVPLTGGFLSKWLLVSAALEQGQWPVAVVVLLGSILAVVYVLRFLEPAIFGSREEAPQVSEAPLGVVVAGCALAAGSVYLGLYGAGVRELVEGAAQALLRGAP